jgi:hypothetical protein
MERSTRCLMPIESSDTAQRSEDLVPDPSLHQSRFWSLKRPADIALWLSQVPDSASSLPIQIRRVSMYNRETLMTLASGTRLGPYEIRAIIGAGGMGEVYRARYPIASNRCH